jgi:hypothetical protein
MKFLLTAILLPSLAAAAILPDAMGAYQRGNASKPAIPTSRSGPNTA